MQIAMTNLLPMGKDFERDSLEVLTAYTMGLGSHQKHHIKKIVDLSIGSLAHSSRGALKKSQALNSLAEFGHLEEDWDGCGAYPISKAAIDAAANFIHNLPEVLSPPELSPNPNGTISLHWAARGHVLEMEIGKTQFAWASLSGPETTTHCSGQNRALCQPNAVLEVASRVASQEDADLNSMGLAMTPIRMRSIWEDLHLP